MVASDEPEMWNDMELGSSPAEHPPYRAGQVIQARYELLHRIGCGGMGEVWLAQHLALGAEVAIKLARTALVAEIGHEHLIHEARVLAGVNHPSVVRVLDFGVAESGFPFLVMELLRGSSLRQVLARKGPLSPRVAVRLLLPVVSALATIHAMGIIHRDLKPDNVMLVAEGSGALTPKLFDFGMAAWTAPSGVVPDDGTLTGSAEYMSPEQVRGGVPVDARTDVWAFCILFYELISGRSLFARGSLIETLDAVVWAPVPPLDACGDPALSAILARGLARSRTHRWSSMQALGEALAAWAIGEGVAEDSTGVSLATHWLHPVLHPLSDPPPRRLRGAWRPPFVVSCSPVCGSVPLRADGTGGG